MNTKRIFFGVVFFVQLFAQKGRISPERRKPLSMNEHNNILNESSRKSYPISLGPQAERLAAPDTPRPKGYVYSK